MMQVQQQTDKEKLKMYMKASPKHLQTDQPIMAFEKWYRELCQLFSDAEKIDLTAAMRHMNVEESYDWWEDGFTPYVTFRENYSI